MKTLAQLEARLIGYRRPNSGEGISFVCPVCGPKHAITAFFANPIDGGEAPPADLALWTRTGESLEQLTVEPSIKHACFHGWVNQGKVFEVSESPIVVALEINGRRQLVALSPLQTLDIAGKAVARAKELLGAG